MAMTIGLRQQRLEAFATGLLTRSNFAEFLDVSPGHECFAATDDDRGLHGVIFIDLFDSLGNAFRHAGAQRVYGRVVDGNDGDLALLRELHKIVHRAIYFLRLSWETR